MSTSKSQGLNEWLVIRSQQGEKQALEELLTYWSKRYLLYAINRLRDREAAKDVTQECLISIGRNIGKLKDPSAYRTWSFRILERRCIDWQRKTIRDRAVVQTRDSIPEIPVNDDLNTELSVEKLLTLLDHRISTVLRLFYLEGLTVEDIAEVSNLPIGTVKSRLFYGRKLLAEKLE
ncbi:MAG: RNA polymerase sigma factor [Pseudohongiellaceae bacterium]